MKVMTSFHIFKMISQFGKLSSYVWFISTFYYKLCELMQTLVITLLVQFLKKVPSHHLVQIEFAFKSYQPTCSYNLNLEFCLKKE
jgi:hypothetical protein